MPPSGFNLARFDFVSIHLAVACAQTGSLTSAARDRNLSLPAASRRIRDLENALGDALFERHSRGLAPTAVGRVFLQHSLNMLQEMESLASEIADLRQGIARHILLCSSTAAINQFLSPLLARHAETCPQIQVEVEEQLSELVVASLRDGRADIGVFVEGPDIYGLEVRDFRKDELVLVLPAGHRLAGRTPISFADTLDEQWISLNAGAAMLQKQQQAALAAGRTFKLRMQVRSFDAVGNLVASRLGIAALPKGTAVPLARALRLTWRPLADGWAQRQLKVAIRPGPDTAVVALRNFLCAPSRNAKTA
ncbi:LysR family transcriptional regulator [Candidimonas nitroreducens]|uniref:LysR family transcriptional regulator n=1 Tax=Candidimonas nitroreducens TaxID=683354 RepID=A0A225MY71_9BURK|nr:LysR family transcriptional regulator [Candidimonas nitroreducens]OWT63649.1 LysR family transcriptional regulator [Candidimonas nitroreducens]